MQEYGSACDDPTVRIALVEQDTIRVLDLSSHEVSRIALKNADEVRRHGEPNSISWAPSGSGFYLTNWTVLFHVDFTGQVRELCQTGGSMSSPVPSPDRRHIAFTQANGGRNAWLLEGF